MGDHHLGEHHLGLVVIAGGGRRRVIIGIEPVVEGAAVGEEVPPQAARVRVATTVAADIARCRIGSFSCAYEVG
jgi:hypothetical protein